MKGKPVFYLVLTAIIIAALIYILRGKSYLGRADLPRGIRNNNPGNLRIGAADWKGAVSKDENTDGSFVQFKSINYGLRALFVLLRNYIGRGKNTLRLILTTYAPATENNTGGYISHLSQRTGIDPDAVILASDGRTLRAIAEAIVLIENGQKAAKMISQADYLRAWISSKF